MRLQRPQEKCYSFIPVFAVFPCVQTVIWLSVFGILNVSTDVDDAIARRGSTNSVRESALNSP